MKPFLIGAVLIGLFNLAMFCGTRWALFVDDISYDNYKTKTDCEIHAAEISSNFILGERPLPKIECILVNGYGTPKEENKPIKRSANERNRTSSKVFARM